MTETALARGKEVVCKGGMQAEVASMAKEVQHSQGREGEGALTTS